MALHYASRFFTISVLRLDDRQDWRDTPHIAIYVVLYTEIHIIYFRTRTLDYYSMSGVLIPSNLRNRKSHLFFGNVMVAITLALHTVWGDGVSATLGCCWLHLVSDPAKNISVVLVLYWATLHGHHQPWRTTHRYSTSSGHLLTTIIHRNHQVTPQSNHPLSDTSKVS